MNVLIAEGEMLMSERISSMLKKYDSKIRVVKVADSIKEVVSYCHSNPPVDLALLDTDLSDGLVFKIFDQIEIETPIIFTTTDDRYALEAFKVNSVDYILKPIKYNDLVRALDKFKKHWIYSQKKATNHAGDFKKRFMVKFGDRVQIKNVNEIRCFHANGKACYLYSSENGRKYLIDHTLEDLENGLLDPVDFFRINRKFIVNINAIEEVKTYVNRRLRIILKINTDKDLIVSREKVNDFKNWLNQ